MEEIRVKGIVQLAELEVHLLRELRLEHGVMTPLVPMRMPICRW